MTVPSEAVQAQGIMEDIPGTSLGLLLYLFKLQHNSNLVIVSGPM